MREAESMPRQINSLQLIGFDARHSCALSRNAMMPPDRAQASLIRPELSRICTADRSVWPSVFAGPLDKYPYPVLPASIPPPVGNGYFDAFDMWGDLASMYASHQDATIPDYGIAIALLARSEYPWAAQFDDWFEAIDAPGVKPSKPGEDWPFLGFDIANSGLQSALTGFVLDQSLGCWRQRWTPEINDLHLLSNLPAATAFCRNANRELSDGPFYVMGLFLIWDGVGDIARSARSALRAPRKTLGA